MKQIDPITIHSDDFNLVEKIKDSDEEAFQQLYQRYVSKTYRVSKKMGLDHYDAEEVVQQVFMHLWNKREQLKPELSINAYIFSIVRTQVIKISRKRASFIAYQKYAIHLKGDMSNVTEDTVIYEDLEKVAMMAIEALPTKQREVFEMKTMQHMNAEEIASQLNISVRTVENQIYRATKVLREKLDTVQGVSYSVFLLFIAFLF